MEEKLLLSDFLHLCVAFKKDPIEENSQKITNFVDSIEVVSYMPIRQKQIAIALILNCATFTEDLSNNQGINPDVTEITINTEAGKIIFGLLNYAINLENDLGNDAVDLSMYDLFFQFGVVDHILQYCEEDYHRLEKMVAEAGNYSNLYRLSQTVSLMSPDNLNAFVDIVNSYKEELTDEKINAIKSFLTDNDPAWVALKETVGESAVSNAMKKEFDSVKVTEKKEN